MLGEKLCGGQVSSVRRALALLARCPGCQSWTGRAIFRPCDICHPQVAVTLAGYTPTEAHG
ncbi:hypothetical protein DPMN_110794 [Dreissena polymorpha]|uniref:Uncharacterized protein n=1 Tax=Dreissena polymorpha TaxID=45954 RepID=A0A9D4QPA0_DREPO|nr:hypothetical protein DPMN_110794 [Dreissena polymorpha]